MGNVKTLIPTLAMLLFPPLGQAGNVPSGDVVATFATCAGRLSALMQHQWLISDPASDETEARRRVMLDLLEAVMPETGGRVVLGHRTAGRQAHSALLTRATFNEDSEDAAWATRRAEAEILPCMTLALD